MLYNPPLYGRFEFSKTDAQTGKLIIAKFKVQRNENFGTPNPEDWKDYYPLNADGTQGTKLLEFSTKADEEYLSDYLPPGEYRIVEVSVSSTYTKTVEPTDPFEIKQGVITTGVTMENVRKGSLRIIKRSQFNGGDLVAMSGATFKLYEVLATDPTTDTLTSVQRQAILDDASRTAAGTGTTAGANGEVTITGLDANNKNGSTYSKDYWLIETANSNDGYNPATFVARKVTVVPGPTVTTVGGSGELVNVPVWGKLKIRKVDANDSNDATKGLEGAVFSIHTDASCTDTNKVGTITTDADGYGESGLLAPGNYFLK
ncbi:prealbumin-like fold domain-containing protein, partial [Christensenellaceae bacterium OttesenSCG-928-K19]|nr:prealbumin-like fold domain-containing protein [Christensenellaceae bacterium OttesenSCG-928-K19]